MWDQIAGVREKDLIGIPMEREAVRVVSAPSILSDEEAAQYAVSPKSTAPDGRRQHCVKSQTSLEYRHQGAPAKGLLPIDPSQNLVHTGDDTQVLTVTTSTFGQA